MPAGGIRATRAHGIDTFIDLKIFLFAVEVGKQNRNHAGYETC
jgi:hypothetical protein